MEFKLEICVDSVDSVLNAQDAGADRIELCSSLALGGITPSWGLIEAARKNFNSKLFVLIRPRAGDFLYNDSEFDMMRRDIEICGEAGIDGIVTGLLNADGTIDTERTGLLAEIAHPMELTFHRAFDMCLNPAEALADIISTGAKRLLTSGQEVSAIKGIHTIRDLVVRAQGKISIMPGGGLNPDNILEVATFTGAHEFHLSARKKVMSQMVFRNNNVAMGGHDTDADEYMHSTADREMISGIISILKMI